GLDGVDRGLAGAERGLLLVELLPAHELVLMQLPRSGQRRLCEPAGRTFLLEARPRLAQRLVDLGRLDHGQELPRGDAVADVHLDGLPAPPRSGRAAPLPPP